MRAVEILALAALMLVSCKEKEETIKAPSISLDRMEMTISAVSGKDSLKVTANRGWQAEVEKGCTWLSIRTPESVNHDLVTKEDWLVVAFEANPDLTPRDTYFRIEGKGFIKTVNVFQKGGHE